MVAVNASAPERCLLLRPDDSVGLLTRTAAAGTDVVAGGARLRLRDEVPAGHKVALREIPRGEQVRKYGQVIGVATSDIAAGEHVHTHNLAFAEFERDYAFGIDAKGRKPPRRGRLRRSAASSGRMDASPPGTTWAF